MKPAELLEDLKEGVKALTTTTEWRDMLDFAAKFHRYSFYNQMLIRHQRPNATLVAGYRRWQELGRQVLKGSKAIWILAPVTKNVETENEDGTVKVDRVMWFKGVCVFDVSQTDGPEMGAEISPRLEGSAPEMLWDVLACQVEAQGFTLERGDTSSQGAECNGWTDFTTMTVRVSGSVSDAQAAKTLAHELAHVRLGHGNSTLPREHREVEAESVAYIICRTAGLDSATYSFGYVAGWAGGDLKVVEQTAARILEAAASILEDLEQAAALVAA